MKAMILAAGRGERMRELTADLPKPLLEIGDESLIERHLRQLCDAGIDEVVINLSYLGERIRTALGDVSAWGQTLRYSEEGATALETAGGILAALPLLGTGPFLVVSADVYTDFDVATLQLGAAEGCLMLVPNPAHHPEGDFGLDEAGVVTLTPPLSTYGGIALLSPRLFDGLPPGRRRIRPVFEAAIQRGALTGVLHEGHWSDVGTPERLEELRVEVGGTISKKGT